MSERKTSEIKLRVTPSFKARVQSAAAKEDVSMSEWLEQAAEQRMEQRPLGFPPGPYLYPVPQLPPPGWVSHTTMTTGGPANKDDRWTVAKEIRLTEGPDFVAPTPGLMVIETKGDPPDLERDDASKDWKFKPRG